jgi:hypothetical protein
MQAMRTSVSVTRTLQPKLASADESMFLICPWILASLEESGRTSTKILDVIANILRDEGVLACFPPASFTISETQAILRRLDGVILLGDEAGNVTENAWQMRSMAKELGKQIIGIHILCAYEDIVLLHSQRDIICTHRSSGQLSHPRMIIAKKGTVNIVRH